MDRCRHGCLFGAGNASVRRIAPDTTKRPLPADTLHYPIHDRRGDQISSFDPNPFNLKNPSNLKDSIEYDPKTNLYYLVEKIGNKYYRTPTAYTYEEYLKLTSAGSRRKIISASGPTC